MLPCECMQYTIGQRTTHPSGREVVLELKGGELGPEGGVVALQLRAMPFQPPRLVLFGAELLFDELLLLAALVQRGPGLPRLVPAVHQVGGWVGGVQHRRRDNGVDAVLLLLRCWSGVVSVARHRGWGWFAAGTERLVRGWFGEGQVE